MSETAVNPSRIMEIGMGFFASKVLLSAVELDLFGALSGGPLSAEALRTRLDLHPRGALDFFDALVALHFLERAGSGPNALYSNTPETTAFLVPGNPAFVGGILRMANRRLYPFWAQLTAALRSGKPQNELTGGAEIDPFATLYADPAALEEFVDAMTGVQRANFRLLAERFNFANYDNACDVGGAGATLSIEIARRHANVRCLSYDLEPVTAIARRRIEAAGLVGRIDAIAGNFMEGPLPRADVILMGNILHDWGTATKEMLIRKAWEALPPGGAFIAIENIIDDARRANALGLLMSLNMLIETPEGYDYTFTQFETWCHKAGFSRTDRIALAGASSAAIAYR